MGILDSVMAGLSAGFGTAALGQMEQYKSLVEQDRLEALQNAKAKLDVDTHNAKAAADLVRAKQVADERTAKVNGALAGMADATRDKVRASLAPVEGSESELRGDAALDESADAARDRYMKSPVALADALIQTGHYDEGLKYRKDVHDEQKIAISEKAQLAREAQIAADAARKDEREYRLAVGTLGQQGAASARMDLESRKQDFKERQEFEAKQTEKMEKTIERVHFAPPKHVKDLNPDVKDNPEATGYLRSLAGEFRDVGQPPAQAVSLAEGIVRRAQNIAEADVAAKKVTPAGYNDRFESAIGEVQRSMAAAARAKDAPQKATSQAEPRRVVDPYAKRIPPVTPGLTLSDREREFGLDPNRSSDPDYVREFGRAQ